MPIQAEMHALFSNTYMLQIHRSLKFSQYKLPWNSGTIIKIFRGVFQVFQTQSFLFWRHFHIMRPSQNYHASVMVRIFIKRLFFLYSQATWLAGWLASIHENRQLCIIFFFELHRATWMSYLCPIKSCIELSCPG